MAIVLPETFLFSKSLRWFVDWICRTVTVTHVVDVPMVAFEEFCRAKTCLLFVTKQTPPPGHQILMSFPRSIGQDKKGDPLYKLDAGVRTGELDNEMADAVKEITAHAYTGRTGGVPWPEEAGSPFASYRQLRGREAFLCPVSGGGRTLGTI